MFRVVRIMLLMSFLIPSFASGAKKWPKNTRAPEFLQRGAGLYSYYSVPRMSLVSWRNKKVSADEYMKALGDTPPSIIHDFAPYVRRSETMAEEDWARIDARLRKHGIVNIVRIEGINFFANEDVNDTYKRIVYRDWSPPFGFSYSWHGYRHNLNWFEKFPETKLGSLVRRDGTDSIEYYASALVERRTGAFMNPWLMKMRRLYVLPYLTGEYDFAYDKLDLKKVIYRNYGGVYYDNHVHWLDSYDPWSLAEARKYVQQKVGYPSWDPADDPNPAARRAWNEFFVNKEIEHYLEHQKWYKKELKGGPYYCLSNGKSQLPIIAPLDLLGLSVGTVDSFKSENYGHNWSYGYRAAIAFSNGRPVQKFGNYDVIEAMANRGIPEWVDNKKKEKHLYNVFYKGNPEIYKFCNPGGSVAILVLPWSNIRNGQYAITLDLAWRLDRLGVPSEVATYQDLTRPETMASDYPVVILPGGEVTGGQAADLRKYVDAGGTLIHFGDSCVFKAADWRKGFVELSAGVRGGPAKPEDLLDPDSPKLSAAWQTLHTRVFADRIGGTRWESILPAFGVNPLEPASKQIGKGRLIHFPDQIVPFAELKAALVGADAYAEHLVDPTGACQVTKSVADGDRASVYHIVNTSNKPARGVRMNLAMRGNEKAILLCPNLLASDVAVTKSANGATSASLPEFDKYALIVTSSDHALLETLRKREAERISKMDEPLRCDSKNWRPLKDVRQIRLQQPGDQGRKVYLHRMAIPNLRRLVYADIEYPWQIQPGETATISIKIERLGYWGSAYVYFEQPQLVFRNTDTLESEAVAFQNFPVPDESNYPKQTGPSLYGKTFSVKWAPKKPGRYEVFLQYRYTNTVMEGEPNFTDKARYGKPLRNYFKGEPRQKVRYTDRLSPLSIAVRK